MLLNKFFTISNLEPLGFDIKAELIINANHQIFEGHFPGRSVVPGVCMMQVVKEIMEGVLQKKLNLVKAHEMKFLAVIDPQQNNNIQAALKYIFEDNGTITVLATLFKDELIYFKFKGVLTVL
jgi:3-hydroxyacyl-[acyl-carrier-protein] dehydratase